MGELLYSRTVKETEYTRGGKIITRRDTLNAVSRWYQEILLDIGIKRLPSKVSSKNYTFRNGLLLDFVGKEDSYILDTQTSSAQKESWLYNKERLLRYLNNTGKAVEEIFENRTDFLSHFTQNDEAVSKVRSGDELIGLIPDRDTQKFEAYVLVQDIIDK